MDFNPYRIEPVRRNSRRCIGHDYCEPCIYMITATERPGRPALAFVNASAVMERTTIGEAVYQEIVGIHAFHPQIVVYALVVMPDHIHIVMHVKERLPKPLGQVLNGFFGACSRHWQRLAALPAVQPLFKPFNDRILWHKGQLAAMIRYVKDNPRRFIVKLKNPELFRRFNHLQAGNREFAAYGNIFLLRDFDRQQVVVHRADSAQTRSEHMAQWMRCAASGGVLVSPFISPDEREIYKQALAAHGRFVVIRNEGFSDRFKPMGHEFELCASGRLLLIAPWPEKGAAKVTRQEALQMNDLAAFLATYEGPLILKQS